MSDFSNKNVHFFVPYLHIFALISRVDFSQPKYVGRLKSTLLASRFRFHKVKIGVQNYQTDCYVTLADIDFQDSL